MAKDLQLSLRADQETRRKFDVICEMEHRSQSDEFAYLIDQEWAKRFSTAQPCITVQEAEEAAR